MGETAEIQDILHRMERASPSGFAIAFHIVHVTPSYLFQTYDPDWLEYYSANGLVMQDPVVAWSYANNGQVRWSELPDPADVMPKAAEHGLVYGVAMGNEAGGSRSVAGFARADREFDDGEIGALAADFAALHDITLEAGALSAIAHDELKRMSIQFTHPARRDRDN